MKWNTQAELDEESQKPLKDLEEILLTNRGIASAEEKKEFFNPPHPAEISPTDIQIDSQELEKAVARLTQAKEKGETVVIYGDYDADGICATAILWQALHKLGFKAHPFIPIREEHGYGLSLKGLESVIEKFDPDLIVTVDNGIVAHEPAAWLKDRPSKKIDLIITDHHQLAETLPTAQAIVHSDQVCGTVVAWYVASECLKQVKGHEVDGLKRNMLDLVAIGTIADMMPMVGVNRSYAKHGLDSLTQSERPGIVALKKAAGISPDQEMTGYHVGFLLGPRINAMGRIGDGLDALRLLCTGSETKAQELAETLDDTNKQRQDLTQESLERAISDYEALDQSADPVIVLAGDYHEGIIGLIAGKLAEKYYKPAVVISRDGEVSKGSARSVSGINIIELIRTCQTHLVGAGGHPAAAGLSIETAKIEIFTQEFVAKAREQIDPSLLEKTLDIDCQISIDLVDFELTDLVQRFVPFGLGNHQPIFASEAEILDLRQVGRDSSHLKMVLKQSGKPLEAMAFGKGHWAEKLSPGTTATIAYTVGVNEWNGRRSVQVVVRGYK